MMRKNKLFLGSIIITGFVLSVSASDIVEGINNAQNNGQPVASSSTIQPIASSSTAVVENLKI